MGFKEAKKNPDTGKEIIYIICNIYYIFPSVL